MVWKLNSNDDWFHLFILIILLKFSYAAPDFFYGIWVFSKQITSRDWIIILFQDVDKISFFSRSLTGISHKQESASIGSVVCDLCINPLQFSDGHISPATSFHCFFGLPFFWSIQMQVLRLLLDSFYYIFYMSQSLLLSLQELLLLFILVILWNSSFLILSFRALPHIIHKILNFVAFIFLPPDRQTLLCQVKAKLVDFNYSKWVLSKIIILHKSNCT